MILDKCNMGWYSNGVKNKTKKCYVKKILTKILSKNIKVFGLKKYSLLLLLNHIKIIRPFFTQKDIVIWNVNHITHERQKPISSTHLKDKARNKKARLQENYDLVNSWKRWWLNKCFCAKSMIHSKTYLVVRIS